MLRVVDNLGRWVQEHPPTRLWISQGLGFDEPAFIIAEEFFFVDYG